jgi:hypothetical protein
LFERARLGWRFRLQRFPPQLVDRTNRRDAQLIRSGRRLDVAPVHDHVADANAGRAPRGIQAEAHLAGDRHRRARGVEDRVRPVRQGDVVPELIQHVHAPVSLEHVPTLRRVGAVLSDQPLPP